MSYNLTNEHEHELIKFMKFFNLKRDEFIKDRQKDLKDFLKDSLNDDIYSKEDVLNLFEKYFKENEIYSEKDLTLLIQLSCSYLQSLLFEADQNKVELHVDMNSIENNQAIENLKNLERNSKNIDISKPSIVKKFASRLPSINSNYNNDPALLSKINELEKENELLKSKNQNFQKDLISISKEKKNNVNNVLSIDDYSLKSEEEYKEEINKIEKNNLINNEENLRLKKDLEKLKEEFNKKLSESTQVGNLKKMIQEKNDQVKSLKQRLSKYEKLETND